MTPPVPVVPEGLFNLGVWFDKTTGAVLADEGTAVGLGCLLFVLAVTLGALTARAVMP